MTDTKEEYCVRVPVAVAVEAWHWIIDRNGTPDLNEAERNRLSRNLGLAAVDGRRRIEFVLSDSALTDEQKMMFKLTFAG